MKTIKINNTLFKGQYANALESLQNNKVITMHDFTNGGWEATSKVSRFITLLNESKINYKKEGSSLRSTMIIKLS